MVRSSDAANWLRARPGDVYTIADGGTHAIENVKAPDGTEGRKLILGVKESPLRLILNSTSRKAIEAVWGEETDKWVGKKLRASTVKMNVRGNLTDVVVFEPVKGK
jgi:hypothetical protein